MTKQIYDTVNVGDVVFDVYARLWRYAGDSIHMPEHDIDIISVDPDCDDCVLDCILEELYNRSNNGQYN
jgi:hypothetical protein